MFSSRFFISGDDDVISLESRSLNFLVTVDSRSVEPSRELEKSSSYREFEVNNRSKEISKGMGRECN